MTRRKSADPPEHTVCIYSDQSPLCRMLAESGVPQDTRWHTLILTLRGLEQDPTLTLGQKSELQQLVVWVLKQRDYGEERLREAMAMKEQIVSAPYREKLAALVRESAAMVKEFGEVLGRRTGDVQGLESAALEAVQSGLPAEEVALTLRRHFRALVESLQRDAQDLQRLATTDPLTGLRNRRSFDAAMEERRAAFLERGEGTALLMVDIDHFKNVNDTYGHQIGDKLLKAMAERMVQTVAKAGVDGAACARYGGEEFAVILPGMGRERGAEVAEAVRQAVERFSFVVRTTQGEVLKKNLRVSVSIGVGAVRPDFTAGFVSRLIDAADSALLKAKNSGRNLVVAASE
ncbi:MAG: GGDEF domain-containing protein [Thermodesulfobacteriota bacterium]